MKKYLFVLLTLAAPSYAGLITHSNYVDGQTITAAGQNSNENAIFNEFNGNIDNTNIKTGGITSTNILDGTIQLGDLQTTLQSTFTYVQTIGASRRPNLLWHDTVTVDLENNTGVSAQTCVQFPDSQRCVTESVSGSPIARRIITSNTASFSGTKASGFAPGESLASNFWYALYAVKASDNSTDFVTAISSIVPVQNNYTLLNTKFGTNSWTYLGMIRCGDGISTHNQVLAFVQTGHLTTFNNSLTGSSNSILLSGVEMATGNAASLTYTASSGVSGAVIPVNLTTVSYLAGTEASGATGTEVFLKRQTNSTYLQTLFTNNLGSMMGTVIVAAADGVALSNSAGSSLRSEIVLTGFWDGALGVGFNPQL